MPPGAYNRVADNWRPIFAIAQIAGGDWPQLALEAYHHLAHQRATENPLSGQNPTNADLSKQSPTKAYPPSAFSLQPSAFLLAPVFSIRDRKC